MSPRPKVDLHKPYTFFTQNMHILCIRTADYLPQMSHIANTATMCLFTGNFTALSALGLPTAFHSLIGLFAALISFC